MQPCTGSTATPRAQESVQRLILPPPEVGRRATGTASVPPAKPWKCAALGRTYDAMRAGRPRSQAWLTTINSLTVGHPRNPWTALSTLCSSQGWTALSTLCPSQDWTALSTLCPSQGWTALSTLCPSQDWICKYNSDVIAGLGSMEFYQNRGRVTDFREEVAQLFFLDPTEVLGIQAVHPFA
jgi:hypothetical protein